VPYCRRCGTPLTEEARFCQKCGTPVESYIPPQAPAVYPTRPKHRDHLVWVTLGVIAIVLVAAIVSVVAFAPIYNVNYNQTEMDSHPDVNTLNLNFQCDTGQVSIMTQSVADKNIIIDVSAEGGRGIFSSENPVGFTFSNDSANGVLTVNSKVTQEGLSSGKVVCTILVNPALKLNLNVTSTTGEVSFSAFNSDTVVTIESLYLQATTGTVQANLESNTTVAGDISLKSQTGAVYYHMEQANVEGNHTINLQTTTGSVDMEITEEKTLRGNLQVNAATATGTIVVNLQIDADISAKITSQTSQAGNVHVNAQNFSGDQSPIQSNNYPAQGNIEINNTVSVSGDVNISANYASAVTPAVRN
jgi:hypothetical protein